jgi:hypothetical protein
MTVDNGSSAKRQIRKPIVEFQNPVAIQGKVKKNKTSNAISVTLRPLIESALAISQSMPIIVAMTRVPNKMRLPDMEGLVVSFWFMFRR